MTQPLSNTDSKASLKRTSLTPLLKHSNWVELSMSIHTIGSNKNVEKKEKEKDTFAEMSSKKRTVSVPLKPINLPTIKLNPNVEFIAFGIGNIIGSFFGSMVISASFSRSGLNNEMRGHTQVSSLLQSIICLFCLLFLMPLLSITKCGISISCRNICT